MDTIVYAKRGCPFGTRAKNLLDDCKVEYELHILDDRKEMLRLKEQWSWRTFPIIVVGGKCVGGYAELKAIHDRGDLMAMLGC